MSKVTISDFTIALFELAEAEGKALRQSIRIFLTEERLALEQTAFTSGLSIALAGAAIVSLLVALGFLSWGVYGLCLTYISPQAAPFITGILWLVISLVFMKAAGRKKKNGH